MQDTLGIRTSWTWTLIVGFSNAWRTKRILLLQTRRINDDGYSVSLQVTAHTTNVVRTSLLCRVTVSHRTPSVRLSLSTIVFPDNVLALVVFLVCDTSLIAEHRNAIQCSRIRDPMTTITLCVSSSECRAWLWLSFARSCFWGFITTKRMKIFYLLVALNARYFYFHIQRINDNKNESLDTLSVSHTRARRQTAGGYVCNCMLKAK